MTGVEPAVRRTGGRLAAYLFLGAGTVTALDTFLAPPPGANRGALMVVSVLALTVGIGMFLAPWQRWPNGATLVVVPLALALITVGNHVGGKDPYSYAVYFVVLFVWLGVSHPRWMSAKLAPLAALAYMLPFVVVAGSPPVAASSALVAIPVCVLVGETIASVIAQARRAETIAAHRAAGMEALAAAETTIEAEVDARRVAQRSAELAVEILRASGTAVFGAGPDRLQVLGAHGVEPMAAAAAVIMAEVTGTAPPGMLVVPLPGTVAPVGALVVFFAGGVCPDDGFTEPAARLFAAKVARAIEQVQVVEALTDAAVRDGLTGIGNRRHADTLVATLTPGDAVVLIDLDRFKEVNDALGHGAGDDVLIAVGRYLREHVRQADDVARLGGEEFLVVLRQDRSSLAAACRLVEGWRRAGGATTFSAGVDVHVAGRTPAETMRRADQALYEAKRTGRDRAVTWSPIAADAPHGPAIAADAPHGPAIATG
jgi:diguanylate cyclase (GGDEF)-like protein